MGEVETEPRKIETTQAFQRPGLCRFALGAAANHWEPLLSFLREHGSIDIDKLGIKIQVAISPILAGESLNSEIKCEVACLIKLHSALVYLYFQSSGLIEASLENMLDPFFDSNRRCLQALSTDVDIRPEPDFINQREFESIKAYGSDEATIPDFNSYPRPIFRAASSRLEFRHFQLVETSAMGPDVPMICTPTIKRSFSQPLLG